MLADLQCSRDRGIAYLVQAQQVDGAWIDFDLPVGRSDQWTTGFVGTHLALSGESAASCAAATWLAAQPGGGRWGFNRGCEADTDSTAWAAMCMARLAAGGAEVDWPWVWQHRRDGGFATYSGSDAWCDAHSCVTPVVWLALPPALQRQARPECLDHVLQARRADGTWSGYWWSGAFYPTLWTVRSLLSMGAPVSAPPGGWCEVPSLGTLRSAAELAWLLDLAVLGGESAMRARRLASALMGLQRAEGGWPPSRCLRVTPHWLREDRGDCGNREEGACEGRVYADAAGLLTTAAAVLALNDLVNAWA